uniref:Uncharacterized protein n=1 Tax=Caenorhabditis japonica TaxID=281687 RepID=A0A8R1DQJ6_CAEJA
MNNTNRGFTEELPENFLDTISPHPMTPTVSTSSATGSSTSSDEPATSSTPQLASLAPMNLSAEQPSSSFSSISSTYVHIKNEPE